MRVAVVGAGFEQHLLRAIRWPMPADRRKIRAALRKACSQHLWMAVPRELEDGIVDEAARCIADEDVDASPYGPLLELAAFMAHDLHGHGTFAAVYDDVVVVLAITHPKAFDDGEPGTYRVIRGCR